MFVLLGLFYPADWMAIQWSSEQPTVLAQRERCLSLVPPSSGHREDAVSLSERVLLQVSTER